MPHATAEDRRRYNKKYNTHNPRHDYFSNLRSMGAAKVIFLSDGNGHICEEIPTCRKSADVALQYRRDTVYLCADGYRRLQEMK